VKGKKALQARQSAAKKTATAIAKTALEKSAGNVKVLDVRALVGYTDYVVICEAASDRQAKAIADHIETTLKAGGERPFIVEGYDAGSWILLDYSDVIAHIFQPDVREFYDLDGLWADAKQVTGWDKPEPAPEPAKPAAPVKKAAAKKAVKGRQKPGK
jgi:ribosome-associated protein